MNQTAIKHRPVPPNVESEPMLTCKRILQYIVLTLGAGTAIVLALSLYTSATAAESARNSPAPTINTVPGMLPVSDPNNLYSETQAGKLSPAVNSALPRIYVPNRQSNSGNQPAARRPHGISQDAWCIVNFLFVRSPFCK
jgi:hypothetical protein